MAGTTYETVLAGIQATIAAHAQAQDDGRADDMAALYVKDAVLEVPGIGTYEGADAIREAWSSWTPQLPQRHMVVNTVVTDWSEREAAATSDVVFVQKGEAGWSVQMVARYHDVFRCTDGRWLLTRRADEFIGMDPPTMAVD
jgi:uncharacterized protein (TIGR02246 family)